MKFGVLQRYKTSDQGTFGLLNFSTWNCSTGELPWRNNLPGKSCIPAGTYIANPFNSPTHGPCYKLTNVPGRTDVELHVGNFCGNTDQGYKSDVLGCIILGSICTEIEGQLAVADSADTYKRFLSLLAGDSLHIEIRDVPVPPEGK